jgi:hypothetical protein
VTAQLDGVGAGVRRIPRQDPAVFTSGDHPAVAEHRQPVAGVVAEFDRVGAGVGRIPHQQLVRHPSDHTPVCQYRHRAHPEFWVTEFDRVGAGVGRIPYQQLAPDRTDHSPVAEYRHRSHHVFWVTEFDRVGAGVGRIPELNHEVTPITSGDCYPPVAQHRQHAVVAFQLDRGTTRVSRIPDKHLTPRTGDHPPVAQHRHRVNVVVAELDWVGAGEGKVPDEYPVVFWAGTDQARARNYPSVTECRDRGHRPDVAAELDGEGGICPAGCPHRYGTVVGEGSQPVSGGRGDALLVQFHRLQDQRFQIADEWNQVQFDERDCYLRPANTTARARKTRRVHRRA